MAGNLTHLEVKGRPCVPLDMAVDNDEPLNNDVPLNRNVPMSSDAAHSQEGNPHAAVPHICGA